MIGVRFFYGIRITVYTVLSSHCFAWLLNYAIHLRAPAVSEWIEVSYEAFQNGRDGFNIIYRSPPYTAHSDTHVGMNSLMLVAYSHLMEQVSLVFPMAPRFHVAIFRGDWDRFYDRRVYVRVDAAIGAVTGTAVSRGGA